MSKKEYVIARLVVKGKRFEVLVDPEKAYRYKEGEKISIEEVVVGDYIYKDAKKGLKASPSELQEVFGTDDVYKISAEIVKNGELQLTTEQRRKLLEMKRKQIIYYIARSAIDPKTKTPIPPTRIEKAMEEAKVSVDLYKSVEEQVADIVKAISKIIPIRIAKALVEIVIPAEYASKVAGQIMKLGEVKKSNWLANGSLVVQLEIPAGMQNELIDKVNDISKGNASIRVLNIV
ncbi:ribosome assembly factor SBDS [Ignisphaera sp. 4213-co]|uniref:Ribosome assembly factor SBDS n=1 Tax=Ignisphaera cupida TaxID=3050454 RepID=A0ABD4Z574_9CREN|nr:ribosome assembly factor SBDS [Ignisphaera sp. 4213-co]MDK6028269.1 ribosome assembly factor SBDS [Ignisphaera sp. 4213-co]